MASRQRQAIPNLIQGVSQQSAELRRDTQAEIQYDCINSPKNGADARKGFEITKAHLGVQMFGAHTFEIRRGVEEHYMAAIRNGTIRVFDLKTGEECTVNLGTGAAAYLTSVGQAQDVFTSRTVGDRTFIANGERTPAMLSTVHPLRKPEALIFIKTGNYACRYRVAIRYGGLRYTYTYETPDNSDPVNAQWINTDQIAASMYRTMTDTEANAPGVDHGGGIAWSGFPGNNTGTVGTNGLLTDAGFSVAINGSLLRIWREDGADFEIDTSDGLSDQGLMAFKDVVRTFTDLPRGGFAGFTLRINGVQNDKSADYWVAYGTEGYAGTSTTGSSGVWKEVPAPGTKTKLDDTTMPHVLRSVSPGVFAFEKLVWSDRIAGDAINSAKDPGFVGRPITYLGYNDQRLSIQTEATVDWSKARNPYTFFPDTVQTRLDDAPIGIEIAGDEGTVAVLEKQVAIDEATFIWADGSQYRVATPSSEVFKEATVEAKPSTSYEFSYKAGFGKAGSTLYFVTEPDEWAMLRAIQFVNGKPQGDTDISAHANSYVPAGVRQIAVSDSRNAIALRTDGDPRSIYLYNYLDRGQERVQSAWNKWRVPGRPLWISIKSNYMHVALQRSEGLFFGRVPLLSETCDEGHTDWRTRLDLRFTEADCTAVFDEFENETTITIPYVFSPTEQGQARLALREAYGTLPRGYVAEILRWVGDNSVVVRGDWTPFLYFAGIRIYSTRTESRFYVRTESGHLPTDDLTLHEFRLNYAATGYTRLYATVNGRIAEDVLDVFTVGMAEPAVDAPVPLRTGTLAIRLGAKADEKLRITYMNDSHLPSRWTAAAYEYEAVFRATPSKNK